MKKAFTMIELVFVIVVIGILATIAIPKFAATRDDATLTKAKTTVANIRAAVSSEVQRRIFEGNYTAINNLGGTVNGYDATLFDYFEGNTTGRRVLEYPPRSCKTNASTGCWMRVNDVSGKGTYIYIMPSGVDLNNTTFTVNNNRFECDATHNPEGCRKLER